MLIRLGSDHQGGRAEHLFTQVWIGDERSGVGSEQTWGRAAGIGCFVEDRRCMIGNTGNRSLEALVHAGSEHTVCGDRRNGLGQLGDETLAVRRRQQDDQARAGAELAAPQGDRGGQGLGQSFTVLFQGSRQRHQRIDRAQLAEERHRARTLVGRLPQRLAALVRTGEGHCGDARMLYQIGAASTRNTLNQRQ
ncbi:hypothetical protein D3C76_849240 [compost metagenome]